MKILSTYKKIQAKEVKVTGFKGKKEAEDAIKRSIELYKKSFGDKK